MPDARHIPECPNDWKSHQPAAGRCYEIELITPLFGGGVETRVNDPSFPIRPTSIRGQLQFWWRATVGTRYATKEQLREAQSAVWGNTEQASRVQVRVEAISFDNPKPCATFERDYKDSSRYRSMPTWNAPFSNTALPYALFPFQGQMADGRRKIEVRPASCIHKANFKLTLTFHKDIDYAKQVEPALWAWVNFGGLGSRTRRGCGAIICKALAPKDSSDLLAKLKRFLEAPTDAREWPTLAAAFHVGREQAQAIEAWNVVIERFRHFRQGVGLGRNPGQQSNRPGRSRYPEPEAIRTVLYNPQTPWPHKRMEHIPNDAFPRAELGLPIVFHFQGQGEPPDTVLYPDNDSEGKKRERMASPLILKPLALANGKFVPLIVRLKTPALAGVDLRQGEKSLPLPQPTVIRDRRLAAYRDSPMQNRSSSGSALEAFLAYAKSQGFTEVTR